jgi:hypothetical protein
MAQSTFVVARICEHVEPIDRGERYEDPLAELLHDLGIGAVIGGGTELSEQGGIQFGDIDIELTDLEQGLAATAQLLTERGAPVGSYLQYQADGQTQRVGFGTVECVAIFLDGAGLPTTIYETTNINELAAQLEARLDGGAIGQIRGSWAGETETSLLIYGPQAQAIADAIEPVLKTYPLCQNSRLTARYRHPDGPSREERLPFH